MVGLLDVARRAGVSTATVSRVLNGSPAVTEEMRARVLDCIRDLDYQPNTFARSLRRGRGRSVALVTGDIEHGIYAGLAKHVQMEFEALNLDVMLFNLGHREDRLRYILDQAVPLGLRGILLASSDVINIDQLSPSFHKASARGVRTLAVSQRLDKYGIPSIVHDDPAGGEAAVLHMHRQGHGPIAFLGRFQTSAVGRERFRGYKRGLKAIGQKVDPRLVWDITEGYRSEAGHRVTLQKLSTGLAVGGVLAASDELALGAMAAAVDHGLRVPDDLAAVGFGGFDWGRFMRPALTTVSLDTVRMACSIARLFHDLDQGKRVDALTRIPPKLIVRGST